MEMPHWEKIYSPKGLGDTGVFRSRVPGGWLVMAMSGMGGTDILFLPDPGHEWAMPAAARRRSAGPGEWAWEEIVLPTGLLPGIGALIRMVKTYRCPVPGGWLVFASSSYPSITFYPDPEHCWSEDAATELEASDAPEGTGTEPVASEPPPEPAPS